MTKRLQEYFKGLNISANIRNLHTNIQGDVLAGITVAMVVLPMALAFGVASGLGAISGLWSAVGAGLIAGPLSGSPWAIGGPTGPITIQVLTIAQTNQTSAGTPDLTFIFTTIVLAGLILIVLGLSKVGQFIRFTPYSVISGFMTGLGILYVLLQINPFLGLPGASSISSALASLPNALAQMNVPACGIGVMTIVVLVVWPRISPVLWLPSPLMALVVSTSVVWILGLDIPTIGEIPTGLPDLHVPHIDLIQAAFMPAAALSGLCVFDSLLTCLIVDNMTGTHHDSDQELIAQGSANIFSGFCGGMGGATNTMPCVVNIQSGAKTRLSAITTGVVLLSLIMGLGPLASQIPLAALAGILMKAGYDILDMRVLPVVRRLPRSDFVVFVLVVGMTVFWNLLAAMAMGLAMAFFRFVKDMADRYKADLDRRADDVKQEEDDLLFAFSRDYTRQFKTQDRVDLGEMSGKLEHLIQERILIVRPHGPLFFGAIDWLNEAVEHLDGKDVLLIRCQWLDELDLSGAYALGDLIEAANRRSIAVLVAGLSDRSKQVLDDLHELDRLQPEYIYNHFPEALQEAVQIVFSKGSPNSVWPLRIS